MMILGDTQHLQLQHRPWIVLYVSFWHDATTHSCLILYSGLLTYIYI